MSLETAPWARRIKELYEQNTPIAEIARDSSLTDWLSDLPLEDSKRSRVSRTVRMLAQAGVLSLRKSDTDPVHTNLGQNGMKMGCGLFEELRERYERLLQVPPTGHCGSMGRRDPSPAHNGVDRQTSVVISDLHIPCERMDLLAEIVRRHGGQGHALYVVGDAFDWEGFSRYDSMDLKPPSMESVLTKAEVVFKLLTEHFSPVYLMEGNHDKRPFKKAMKASSGLAWMTQEFLRWVYRERYGVQLVEKPILCIGDSVTYFTQVGDCVMGHIERGGGKKVSFGAQEAHGHYTRFGRELGVEPFNVVLQAHTHKTSLSRHPDTGKMLCEIGCLCDTPSYAFHRHDFLAPERGYFSLVQENGITNINESRLYVLD